MYTPVLCINLFSLHNIILIFCSIAIPLRNTEMYDLAEKTNSIIKDPTNAESSWSFGGTIKSDHWSADDLTILRAYEWDRINFSDPKKLKKTADIMGISVEELNIIRKRTLSNNIKFFISLSHVF